MAAGSAAALDVGADEVADSSADDAALDADEAVLAASSLEHAATPKIANALSPAPARVLRCVCFIDTVPSSRAAPGRLDV
ncbi:hypothetical protein NIIDNTM18_19900 [Mycolicibacterium litorale]|uniref:Uncharacterized protein n=1 Tax=Mycolicibacterium litorale TaxID=758802 RepID=A0A6S6P3K7_9MYCO|nr:hypothetical protein NIIDNTM18_19900 [Mycolicibacterium litorale]